ncbi:MAG: prepilin-type N-terminal cleavage/methylation domain-containing protein [Pseudomonadota bacterium]
MRERSSSARRPLPEHGFTLPELVAVLIVVGVLAAVAMPRFEAALAIRDDGWHDEVVSALRHARQTAVSHRRLVCATVAGNSVSLGIAATNPASACSVALNGPDGNAPYATSAHGSASVSPAGTMYFQPSGRVTSDGAGTSASSRSITVSGSDTITVIGETGHVE